MTATFVVPNGPVTLRGRLHEGVEVAWTRVLEARGGYLAVAVDAR